MRTFHKFALLGAVSGIISWIIGSGLVLDGLPFSEYLFIPSIYFGPGIIFGLFIASQFKKNRLPFIVISGAGYMFAFLSSGYKAGDLVNFYSWKIFLAGTIGALIMTAGFTTFLSKLTTMRLTLLGLLGGILSFSILIPAQDIYSFLPLFLIWQTGMAGALGWVVEQNEKKKPAKKK